jgi:hypothetical protein
MVNHCHFTVVKAYHCFVDTGGCLFFQNSNFCFLRSCKSSL